MINELRTKKRLWKMNSPSYGNRDNLSISQAKNYLIAKIGSEQPLSVVRMGFGELEFMYECMFREIHHVGNKEYKRKSMADLMREFPNGVETYNKLVRSAFENADLMACWYQTKWEERLIRQFCADETKCTTQHILEPIYDEINWISALEGKRVLVISPFSEQIVAQIPNLKMIYPNGLWPEVTFLTCTSIWYDNMVYKDPRFGNWFEVLEYMKNEIAKTDFDVALLACGTFGTPLVDYIKQIGKQGIYVGGILQMYFGLRGNRWDNDGDKYSVLYNEYWTRLGEINKPAGASALEGDCYW